MPNFITDDGTKWMVSVNRLMTRKSKIIGDWIMDSGGFTQIGKFGGYSISDDTYIDILQRLQPKFAFCKDWMCEPHILKRTGMSVLQHQYLTLQSFLRLNAMDQRIMPVLQGWNPSEYVDHLKMYISHGADTNLLYGVGTICSRNGKPDVIKGIIESIREECPNIKLHAFGVKSQSLVNVSSEIYSADSMAWSYAGRYKKLNCQGCVIKSCQNCRVYATNWRGLLLKLLSGED